ncbi:MAG: hypothetical protein BWY05_01175 [Euryarchaeota archaeon ADurb.Bin165]|nr:MAG: hypothetical protein BWY05_01175 [Euryarchaeota archaeon ADurb.Bin165]
MAEIPLYVPVIFRFLIITFETGLFSGDQIRIPVCKTGASSPNRIDMPDIVWPFPSIMISDPAMVRMVSE